MIPLALPITEGSGISQLYPTNSKPYGLTYGEWSAKWWQWAMSIPTKDSPIVDKTGAKCAVGQNDPNVWFLAGTGGERLSVHIPYLPEKPFSFLLLMWNAL
jgi:hypothetical protein